MTSSMSAMRNSFAAYRARGDLQTTAACASRRQRAIENTRRNSKKVRKACQRFRYSINEKLRRQTGRSSRSKYFQKSEKKACQRFRYSINEKLRRQTGRSSRSKYFQKSEKKACQPFKYSIIPTKT